MRLLGSNTVFHVSDLERSIAFYSDFLGFTVDFRVGDPANYAGLSCSGSAGHVARLHLGSQLPFKNSVGHGNIYLVFDEVDALYEKFSHGGCGFYSTVGDQPYGMRDFCVKDPDGNQVGVGCSIVD